MDLQGLARLHAQTVQLLLDGANAQGIMCHWLLIKVRSAACRWVTGSYSITTPPNRFLDLGFVWNSVRIQRHKW